MEFVSTDAPRVMSNSPSEPPIGVLGAGIAGLTSALCLLGDGRKVIVYAREQTPHTTSDVAAAFCLAYRVGGGERICHWSRQTRQVYVRAVAHGTPGVALAPLVVLQRSEVPPSDLPGDLDGITTLARRDLPSGYAHGVRFDVPRIEAPLYLPWLQSEVLRRGGRIETRAVQTIDELLGRHSVVVNCSGLGARSTVPDPSVFPIRGQIIRVSRPVGMAPTIFLHEEDDTLTYVVPRLNDCVLGGTAEDNSWAEEPDPAVAASILERCQQLCPALSDARILAHRVGLRPGRRKVRLEVERRDGGAAIIHNYGHGGAGFTLAWGCADAVVALARLRQLAS